MSAHINGGACAALHSSPPRATPLVELRSVSAATGCRVLAKCEHLHPGGSVKDRAAHALVSAAESSGQLKPGGEIVQATGGNTGIALAMLAAARGYRCTVFVPENVSPDKIELLRLCGATVELCSLVKITDEANYVRRAAAYAAATEGAVLPDQFEDTVNADAHYSGTGAEIWEQSGGRVDGFVCAAGTGGTIAGVSRALKEHAPDCSIRLIDPTGSGLKCFVEEGEFASSGSCFIDGIGISRLTANFARARVDGAFRGDDREAVEMAHYLLRNEGLFVGPSAALNVVGAVKLARELASKARAGASVDAGAPTVVTILCDGGERYRSTTFNAAWLADKGLTPAGVGADLSFVRGADGEASEVTPAP